MPDEIIIRVRPIKKSVLPGLPPEKVDYYIVLDPEHLPLVRHCIPPFHGRHEDWEVVPAVVFDQTQKILQAHGAEMVIVSD